MLPRILLCLVYLGGGDIGHSVSSLLEEQKKILEPVRQDGSLLKEDFVAIGFDSNTA